MMLNIADNADKNNSNFQLHTLDWNWEMEKQERPCESMWLWAKERETQNDILKKTFSSIQKSNHLLQHGRHVCSQKNTKTTQVLLAAWSN